MAKINAIVSFDDYKQLIHIMNMISPKLTKKWRKEMRRIGRPVVKGIKNNIPNEAPLSGMVTKVGRLSWSQTFNQTRGIKSVVVRDRKRQVRGKYPVVGLIQAVVRAAPVGIADMAGRSGRYINARTVTREYDYTYTGKYGGKFVSKRRHKINNQGRRMIEQLGNTPSRYVYPGAEKALPEVKAEMNAALNDVVNDVNKLLRK